ncbi:hypothetical protein [Crocosphaera chwakensis]|uniref:Uncharacterized protein n=1 Tax=Crocosphaera chwakensis CCY0110 TaxID=391612 RepID=A3IPN3_9CHRO|nr:hypothetical protein [Crocosphaera chwakensis]EAZ91523.1 hypothetical protein CY0110_13421 [Crocosphaera chwakensis CCY0110]
MSNLNKYSFYLPKKAGLYLGGIALGVTTLLLPGCQTADEIEEGRTNVTTEDLATDDLEGATGAGGEEILVGQEVTIRAPVKEEISDQAFVVQAEDGTDVLVINSPGQPATLPGDDTPIQVTGEVVEFVIADVEVDYGLELDNDLFVDYETEPAIVAESIALAPTPEQLAEGDAQPFYDQVIAVEGDVGSILSSNTFALYEEGWIDDRGLLVIGVDRALDAENTALQEGETVTVTGRLRDFDLAVLEQEYNLGLDEEEAAEFEARYTDRPVIVAEEVFPSAVED